jgi:hypothetical protein
VICGIVRLTLNMAAEVKLRMGRLQPRSADEQSAHAAVGHD